jgi:hypothetical protein
MPNIQEMIQKIIIIGKKIITHMEESWMSNKNWFRSFPPQQFQALLTLFSKFFASFPRGTCVLSGFCQYLALDGSYHPKFGLRSQAVRLAKEQTYLHVTICYCLMLPVELSARFVRLEQDYHLLWCPFPGDFSAGLTCVTELCLKTTTPEVKKKARKADPGFSA